MAKMVMPIWLLISAYIVVGLHHTTYTVPENVSSSNNTIPENVSENVPTDISNHRESKEIGTLDEDELKTLSSVTTISNTSISTEIKHNLTANLSEPCKSFPNNKIVLVQTNEEYIKKGMFQNWLHYARPFLGKDVQLVVDAEDSTLHKKILEIANLTNPPVIINRKMERMTEADIIGDIETSIEDNLTDADFDQKRLMVEPFGSAAFGNLMSRRPNIIGSFLSEGCPLVLADIDTVWQADVFADIEAAGYHDLYVTDNSCSNLGLTGTAWRFCGCFLYLRPVLGKGDFVSAWYAQTQAMNDNEQLGLNYILQAREGTFKGVDFTILPFNRFPPGCRTKMYANAAHIVHANYLKGIDAKINFLKKVGRWSQGH